MLLIMANVTVVVAVAVVTDRTDEVGHMNMHGQDIITSRCLNNNKINALNAMNAIH